MSTGHVVVDGAMCECQFGTAPDTLVVLTQQKQYINDSGGSKKLIANTMDLGIPFKAKTFGQCKLQPTSSGYLPCVPTITQWQDFYDKVVVSNQGQILTEKSKAMCAISGSPSVAFTWHGQTAGAGNSSVEEAEEEVFGFYIIVNIFSSCYKFYSTIFKYIIPCVIRWSVIYNSTITFFSYLIYNSFLDYRIVWKFIIVRV